MAQRLIVARQGLVAFDLDGTLIRGATACELLAAPLGRLADMQRFEARAGKRETVAAREEMARWYRGRSRASLALGLREATWAPGAREAVAALQDAGIEVAIVSVTWKFAVAWFAGQLGVRHFLGTDLEPRGEIRHVWPADKAAWFRDLGRQLGAPRRRMAAIGDSVGDRPLLRSASLRFYVGAANAPEIPGLTHLPNADLRRIADAILERWAV